MYISKMSYFFRFVRSIVYCPHTCFLSDLGHLDLMLAWYVYLCLTTMRTGWQGMVSTQEWMQYTYLRLYWHIAGVLHQWIVIFCLCLVKNGPTQEWIHWHIAGVLHWWIINFCLCLVKNGPFWPNTSLIIHLFMPNYHEDRLVMKGFHPIMNPL